MTPTATSAIPIYTYSLRQGIDDGFLAPYRVHRIVTDVRRRRLAAQPRANSTATGARFPTSEYQTKDFERIVALKARTEAIARNITDFLKTDGPLCQDHRFLRGSGTRRGNAPALNNLNADLVAAASRLRLPRDVRRRRHRARPPEPLSGRGNDTSR